MVFGKMLRSPPRLDKARLATQAEQLRSLVKRGAVAEAVTACARLSGELEEAMPPFEHRQAVLEAFVKGLSAEDKAALEAALSWFPRAQQLLEASSRADHTVREDDDVDEHQAAP